MTATAAGPRAQRPLPQADGHTPDAAAPGAPRTKMAAAGSRPALPGRLQGKAALRKDGRRGSSSRGRSHLPNDLGRFRTGPEADPLRLLAAAGAGREPPGAACGCATGNRERHPQRRGTAGLYWYPGFGVSAEERGSRVPPATRLGRRSAARLGVPARSSRGACPGIELLCGDVTLRRGAVVGLRCVQCRERVVFISE